MTDDTRRSNSDIERAIKATCKKYRKSCVLGQKMPLTTLRIIWRHAFLAGATHALESVSKPMKKEIIHDK